MAHAERDGALEGSDRLRRQRDLQETLDQRSKEETPGFQLGSVTDALRGRTSGVRSAVNTGLQAAPAPISRIPQATRALGPSGGGGASLSSSLGSRPGSGRRGSLGSGRGLGGLDRARQRGFAALQPPSQPRQQFPRQRPRPVQAQGQGQGQVLSIIEELRSLLGQRAALAAPPAQTAETIQGGPDRFVGAPGALGVGAGAGGPGGLDLSKLDELIQVLQARAGGGDVRSLQRDPDPSPVLGPGGVSIRPTTATPGFQRAPLLPASIQQAPRRSMFF